MRRRIYISGPMRSLPNNNAEAFAAAAEELARDGWLAENPVEIGSRFGLSAERVPSPELLARVMAFEIAVVRSCDAIYLLAGWERSDGARDELKEAIECGLEIIQQDARAQGDGKMKCKPCKYRKRETRDGVTMDWCYAIGCDRIGDMPCVYCNARRRKSTNDTDGARRGGKGG